MYSQGRTSKKDYVEIQDRSSDNFNADNPNNKSLSNDLDRVLYNDLVEIVPLVQSLIVCNSLSSFFFFFFFDFLHPRNVDEQHHFNFMGKYSRFCLAFCGTSSLVSLHSIIIIYHEFYLNYIMNL